MHENTFEGMQVLFIEDDAVVRKGARQALELAGLNVIACATAEEALAHLSPEFAGIVLSDIKLPGIDGLQLLDIAIAQDAHLPVILVTGHGDVSMAVGAMRRGAYDFIEKPFTADLLVEVCRRALDKRHLVLENMNLRRLLEKREGIESRIVGRSAAMAKVRQLVLNLAPKSADIIILGETGTGKELVARCLHDFSDRRDHPFVAINCGALPESIFESELFGHEEGAFTGAQRQRIGKIEYANGGTLFLDEIESMPLALQVKLLRVLQERQVERLGSNKLISVNFRVIAAAKEDLNLLAEQGKFRADLYYRLNVASLTLPALRSRREDIPLLFEFFVLQAALRYGQPAALVSSELLSSLMAQRWSGNVRELHNIADRFVLGLLDDTLAPSGARREASLAEQVDAFERAIIEDALRRHGGNIVAAADNLNIPKKTLYDKLKRFDISTGQFR
ncbi:MULTISPECIES: sigma-54-dependent transcriptional regulator [unclassified Janthinobacterium]|uniref:sigma-54-dependent transcriptional regulator n=1 Tax=unclassified Janthinobacterium TaxID=2610881 RepID=UPI00034561C8|nr:MULTISPECIES: sigma-54 dependent transcriptional regulator [unclassified Janthinobacterium]MEC5164169.1 two-component system C4-dicarboxylate transport response regulator DctD [Janthinobacterium sp. CG_S6]